MPTNYFPKPCVVFFILIFFLPTLLFADCKNSPVDQPLKINLITLCNGKGLDTDQKVLKEALERLDCQVTVVDINETQWSRAHINIFIQALVQEKFFWAQQNWFIPNPEWYEAPLVFLEKVDLILCRTREVEKIFRKLNKPTYYLGFTSPDCYQEDIKKNYSHFFHLAGGSHLKGTKAIKNSWLNDPSLPLLTVVDFFNPSISNQPNLHSISTRLPEQELRTFQNACGIHLCPSEAEGFGHYIMEALSVNAVVITTDAPPMNEFIKDPRCLVPYIKSAPLNLGTRYEVDPKQLRSKIEYLISLPSKELAEIGLQNRSFYLQKQQDFYEKLEDLILTASALKDKI